MWVLRAYTRLGLATRRPAGNEKGAILLGYSPQRLAQSSFVVASLIGAVDRDPGVADDPAVVGIFTFGFLIPALGAALLGGFRTCGRR